MQLSSIKAYLEKYQKKLHEEEDKKSLLATIIFEETGIQLEEKSLQIHRGVLKVKASLVVRNELFMYKEKILQKFHVSGRTDIVDIG